MEDLEPISHLQEPNENNNVDFKNVRNGSVLSSLSKTLDLALIEDSVSVHLEDKLAKSVSCCDPATTPVSATIGSNDIRAVPSTPLATVTEERSKGPHLLQEENIPGSSVSSSSCGDINQTSLIPHVNYLPEESASETRETSNRTPSLNGTAHKYRDESYRPASQTTDDCGSGDLLLDIAGIERLSASSFSTCSSEKLQKDNPEENKRSRREQTLASSNSSTCSFEKSIPDTADVERTSAATSSSTCSSQKPSASLTDSEHSSIAACSSNGLSAEFPHPVVQQPSMSCSASSNNSNSTSPVFPRSSSLLSGPNSFSFPAETLDYESSGDSTDYEEAFDWDLSGNIEYYDFKDREKVKLRHRAPREQDASTSGMDFTSETSFVKASLPLKRKRTHEDEQPSTLRNVKVFENSKVGSHFHQSYISTSSSQPNMRTHSSSVNRTLNSFDDLILSSPTSSNKLLSSKPPSVSLTKTHSTYMFKAPSLSIQACKPPVRLGTAASRLAKQTSSSKLRIGINLKSSPSISSGKTASSKSRIVINSKSSSIRSGSITSLPHTGSGRLSSLPSTDRGSTALLSSTVSGRTASSSSGNSSTALFPDLASAQPNRARMREVLLDVMGRHRRARVQEVERAKKFVACRKELLGDIHKRLHLLQAQCMEGLM